MNTIALTPDQIAALVNAAQKAQAAAMAAERAAEIATLRAQDARKAADEQMALVTAIVTGK